MRLIVKNFSYTTKNMTMRIVLLSLLLSFCIQNKTYADSNSWPNCTNTTAGPAILNLPTSINIATTPANSPLITPITDWFSLNTPSFTGCNALPSNYVYYGSAQYTATSTSYIENGISYNIYPLASGIGYILSAQNATNPASIPTPVPVSPRATQVITSTGNYNTLYRVRLVRYTAITAGTLNIPIIFVTRASDWKYSYVTGGGSAHNQDFYLSATTIKVQTISCSVNTANISVQLPTVVPSQFSSTGSTAGSTSFNIAITCPSAVNVYMTMTDNSNPASTSNIITAASGSTAQGLGIQVRQNGVPVSLGADSSMAGNTNQFLIGSNITGSKSIPFTANYIRTAAVTVGTLKAVATFTMSYQ